MVKKSSNIQSSTERRMVKRGPQQVLLQRPQGRKNEGFAVFLAVLVAVLVMAAAAVIALQIQNRHFLVREQDRRIHLTNLVDSGVALAMAEIHQDRYFSGERESQLDGGKVRFEVEAIAVDRRRVDLLATYHGSKRAARVVIYTGGPRPAVVDWVAVSMGGDGSPVMLGPPVPDGGGNTF